jgi:N-acyl-D-amino-acid deacylase
MGYMYLRSLRTGRMDIMAHFDVVITGGTVVDGTGAPKRAAEVGISGGRITAVAAPGELRAAAAADRIDATGKVVCPGFIDTHSHSDLLVLKEPFIAPKIMQGVTTELIGQDGMSLAPLREDCIPAWKKAMAGLEGDYEVDWDWLDVDGYLTRIEAMDLGPNFAFLAPHGNIRMKVMGLEDRPPTPDETAEMQDLLRECLDQGAFGMSTGMIYPPCCYADTKEFVALCKVLAERDAPFVVHKRNASDRVLESIEELLTHQPAIRDAAPTSPTSKWPADATGEKIDRVFQLLDGARLLLRPVPVRRGQHHAGSHPPSLGPQRRDREAAGKAPESRSKRARMKKDIIDGIEGLGQLRPQSGV